MKTKLLFSAILFSILFTLGFSTKLNAQCSASFTWTAIGGNVQFNNTSTAVSTPICSWTFGDASSMIGFGNMNHTYTFAGTYYVCLTINDTTNFCTNTFCDSVTVLAGCNGLTAFATATDASICQVCDGTVSASVTGGTAPYSYSWSNGPTSISQSNLCIGNYYLTVVDANGCSSSATANVSCPFQCQAGIGYNVSGNSANIYNTSNDTTNSTFQWSFGDNTYSTLSYGEYHTYAAAGTYNVMLIMVNNSAGCTDTAYASITVGGPTSCAASFNMQQDSFTLSLWYIYPSVSGQAPFTYLWDFGDTTTSTQFAPIHNYAFACHHVVCMSITDANGCTSTYCDSSMSHRSASGYILNLVVINPIAGIAENHEFDGKIFPNPVSGFLNISFNKNISGLVQLTDITGKMVLESEFYGSQKQIDVSLLPAGIYSISLVSEKMIWNEKVVIIH